MLILADVRDIDTELWVRSEDTEGRTGEVCVDDENGQCEEQDAKAEFVEGNNTAFSPSKKA
jgi:hypothetical protein